jgi:two-component system nitrogen regulation sensor histidine kinase GlnL
MNARAARARLAVVSRAPDAAAMLSALPVACVLVDAQEHFLAANPAAEHFFAASVTQLRQMTLSDLVGKGSALSELVAQVHGGAMLAAEHELTFDTPRLQRRGVSVQAVPVPEDPGCVLLTFQHDAASRGIDRQLHFRHAARSVAGMAAVLAHEVKNPLSGIRGAAQLLEGSVGPDDRELAVLIRDEADRIRELVDRMEAFGERPVVRDAVNIHRVLEHVRRLAATGFAAHLRIEEAYDPSLPPVLGNRDQLVQVLLNLVKNAAEAITDNAADLERGEITLITAYQHGMRVNQPGSKRRVELPLVVTVRDSGPGIPTEVRECLFDPFVTTKAQGSGLGLALVAKIIGEHGGLIEVDSRPGRTDFRLFLPIFQEDRPHSGAHV